MLGVVARVPVMYLWVYKTTNRLTFTLLKLREIKMSLIVTDLCALVVNSA